MSNSMKKVLSEMQHQAVYSNADTVNEEGFPAWKTPLSKRFVQVLNTGSFGNSFYASQKKLVGESIKTIQEGIEKLPENFLKMEIVRGRNEGFMRTAPITALALFRKKYPKSFKEIFPFVIRTGNDMEDFISINRAFQYGFGRAVKTAMNQWLINIHEYQAIKYKNQIADTMRISRPKTQFPHLLDYVATTFKNIPEEQAKQILETFPQVKHFELAKLAFTNGNLMEGIRHIKEGRVPFPAVIGSVQTDDVRFWTEAMRQMGVMQLIKYTSKLSRVGVFDDPENVEYYKQVITAENLTKAKVLPFRIAIMHREIKDSVPMSILKHLEGVLEDYVCKFDWGVWNGRWAIAVDVSGSMTARFTDTMSYATIAGIFSAILAKGLKNKAVIIPVSTKIREDVLREFNSAESVMEKVHVIEEADGGGTYLEEAVKYLIRNKISIDHFIMITDSEEWGKGWLRSWIAYKNKIAPKAEVFFVRIDPYETSPYSEKEAERYDIYDVFGWNDNVLKFIEFQLSCNRS